MQVATTDPVDIVFDLFFPPIGALIVFGGAYAVARAVAGGRPVSQLTKTILWFSSLLALGIGYDMGLTKLLGFSPETLLVTLPNRFDAKAIPHQKTESRGSGFLLNVKRTRGPFGNSPR
jgi:hypothetical protein